MDCLINSQISVCQSQARLRVFSLLKQHSPWDIMAKIISEAIETEFSETYHGTQEWQYDIDVFPIPGSKIKRTVINYVEVWPKGDKKRKRTSVKINAADHKHHKHQVLINACFEFINVAHAAEAASGCCSFPSAAPHHSFPCFTESLKQL